MPKRPVPDDAADPVVAPGEVLIVVCVPGAGPGSWAPGEVSEPTCNPGKVPVTVSCKIPEPVGIPNEVPELADVPEEVSIAPWVPGVVPESTCTPGKVPELTGLVTIVPEFTGPTDEVPGADIWDSETTAIPATTLLEGTDELLPAGRAPGRSTLLPADPVLVIVRVPDIVPDNISMLD